MFMPVGSINFRRFCRVWYVYGSDLVVFVSCVCVRMSSMPLNGVVLLWMCLKNRYGGRGLSCGVNVCMYWVLLNRSYIFMYGVAAYAPVETS